jgi:hypothetical protein
MELLIALIIIAGVAYGYHIYNVRKNEAEGEALKPEEVAPYKVEVAPSVTPTVEEIAAVATVVSAPVVERQPAAKKPAAPKKSTAPKKPAAMKAKEKAPAKRPAKKPAAKKSA